MNEHNETTRNDRQDREQRQMPPLADRNASAPRSTQLPTDATQRIYVDSQARPRAPRQDSPAQRRTPTTGNANRSRPSSASGNRNGGRKPQQKKPALFGGKFNNTTIALFAVAGVLLIGIIVALFFLFAEPADNGLILNNVYVAGVNIGGMTPAEAKAAVEEATKDTYTQLDMTVEVHTTKVPLTPSRTGAKLNVGAAIDAAYSYGRTGSRADRQRARNLSMTTSHVVSITPYLNLDTDYIQEIVDQFGNKYSSTLTNHEYNITGERPNLNVPTSSIDISKAHQTLTVKLGTAEFGLSTDKLYDQIMEAYNTNIFQVVGEISVKTPEPLDLEYIYAELECVAPVDAVMDSASFEVIPEVYGYGFYIDEVRAILDNAEYGSTVEIPICFLRPAITEADLRDGLFQEQLAFYNTPATIDQDLITNLKLACQAIDGMVIKAGEIFSFNEVVGQPTTAKGYKDVMVYMGKNMVATTGGGISRISSALYYCALKADMTILMRSNHIYDTGFIAAGLDANVMYGSMDFSFENNTSRPIRIRAQVTNSGILQVSIWGKSNDSYTVDVVYETIRTYEPETLKNVMELTNPDEYRNGDVLVQPITGYDVCTYRIYRYTDSSMETTKKLVAFSHYDKLDKLVVEIVDNSQEDPENPGSSDELDDPDSSENSSVSSDFENDNIFGD